MRIFGFGRGRIGYAMRRIVYTLALLAAGNLQAEIDFARDIRPILNAKCTGCHGGVKQAGGVSFVYENQVVGFEGESGNTVVVPGDVDASEIFYRITTDDEIDMMPPPEDHPEGLSDAEKDLIKKWIEEGAEWSGHWSFESPELPEIPALNNPAAARNAVDHFIIRNLESENLTLSPSAETGRLLRRLSLDLIGLPPTLDELEKFETSYSADPDKAVETAINELLARPAFGEKWALMWLDLMRYADSRGLGLDDRRTIWPYRDWVIRAFNNDMPFDQFTIKQLAGDLLPNPTIDDLVATAAHRNTQTNNEGGTDDEEFRVEAIVDRVNTTWQTWGSITFGCVQCHDHPYEAFRHDEYYEFMAFFNNTADSDLSNDAPLARVPNDRKNHTRMISLEDQIRAEKEKLWMLGESAKKEAKWTTLTDYQLQTNNSTKYIAEKVDDLEQFVTSGTVERSPRLTVQASFPKEIEAVTAIRLTALPKNVETALKDSEWGFEINELKAFLLHKNGEAEPISLRASLIDIPWLPHDPYKTVTANGQNFSAFTRIHHARELVLIPEKPIATQDASLQLQILCKGMAHGSFPLVIQRGHLAATGDPGLSALAADETRLAAEKKIAALIKERSSIPSVEIPVMAERPEHIARPTHVFGRGNFLEKEHEVKPGLPASLPAPGRENVDRLEMAKWWVSGDHPLTARVFANRVWEQLFGTGLVATLEDFGSSGEKPSHPELLDYLAVRFQTDHDWSMKALIRDIVTSATYQQSAKTTPELVAKDQSNRLLARGPRPRLNAEMIRDQALAIGGLMASQVGGKPAFPPLPQGVWKPFQSGDKWETPEEGQDDRYRRALYTYTKRSIPYPSFATFDAPSREFCTPRRLVSNTPLQALTTLNDEAFIEAAKGLARRMKYEADGDVASRIEEGYRIATARPPSKEQLGELVGLFDKLESQYASQPELKQGMAGTPDGAAYTIVAQVILNLDEVLSK